MTSILEMLLNLVLAAEAISPGETAVDLEGVYLNYNTSGDELILPFNGTEYRVTAKEI